MFGEGYSALILALRHQHADVANLLLERGADVNIQANDGETALSALDDRIKRLMRKDLQQIPPTKSLLASTVKSSDGDMTTDERAELIQKLKSCGLRVGLREAARLGEIETVGALLDGGAPVDETSAHGATPLYEAVSSGHVDVARLLLDRGASANGLTDARFRITYLETAIMHDDIEMVRHLIERGADVTARNRIGFTIESMARHRPEIKLLIEAALKRDRIEGTAVEGQSA